jgi:hypothetical protein
LVELLTVMAIMSVLAVLAVSSISSLRATSLSASGNQLVDVFAMARQNSISKNDYTAVVILTTGTSACSAYSLIELPSQVDGTRGASWTELTPWRYLPTGVVFESSQANDTFMANTLNTATQPPMLPLSLSAGFPSGYPFQGSSIDLTAPGVVVQCFQPDGTLIWPLTGAQASQPLVLRLIEGTADPTTGKTTNNSGPDYYDLYFLANTGTTKIGRP